MTSTPTNGPDNHGVRHVERFAHREPLQDRGRLVGRRIAAGVHDDHTLHDGIHPQREDHRRDAQERDAEAVGQADQSAASNGNGTPSAVHEGAPPAGNGGGGDPANGDNPGDRQVDMPEQDHDHHTAGDDAEEGGDLQLLQQVETGEELLIIDSAEDQQR